MGGVGGVGLGDAGRGEKDDFGSDLGVIGSDFGDDSTAHGMADENRMGNFFFF